MQLESLLSLMGVTREESRVYLRLASTGPTSVGALARGVGKPRSTLYSLLRRLSEQGLVTESIKRGVVAFHAEEPDRLLQLFQERIEALEKGREELKEILPKLRRSRKHVSITPRLTLHEGKEGLKNVLRDMLLYHDLQTCALWPIRQMIKVLSAEFFELHNQRRIQNRIYTRAIWPKEEVVDLKRYPFLGTGARFEREIRIAPADMHFSLGYWIYGSKVAFLASQSESYGFLVESDELAETLRAQFELIWKSSKPL